jgi:hypothetical protein
MYKIQPITEGGNEKCTQKFTGENEEEKHGAGG